VGVAMIDANLGEACRELGLYRRGVRMVRGLHGHRAAAREDLDSLVLGHWNLADGLASLGQWPRCASCCPRPPRSPPA
jgi:hypothetical protein